MLLSSDLVLLERAPAVREYDGIPLMNPQAPNLKMTDLQAAMGMAQLNRLREFLGWSVSLARSYREAIAGTSAILLAVPTGRPHVYYLCCADFPEGIRLG